MAERKAGKTKIRPLSLWAAGAVILVVAAALFLKLGVGSTSAFATGRQYLQQQSSLEQAAIQTKIADVRKKQLGDAITSGKSTIFSAFNDSVILGDSRILGFQSYGFMPEKQILANTGDSILNIPSHVKQVEAMQPSYIYLSYGVNDMGLGIGGDTAGYTEVYKEKINELLKVSPNSKIIVNSIVECTPEAVKSSPAWKDADSYNSALKKMCEENGWTFVDNTPLSKGGKARIYEGDGIHFIPDFYPVWAEHMIRTEMPDLLGPVDLSATDVFSTSEDTDDTNPDADTADDAATSDAAADPYGTAGIGTETDAADNSSDPSAALEENAYVYDAAEDPYGASSDGAQ